MSWQGQQGQRQGQGQQGFVSGAAGGWWRGSSHAGDSVDSAVLAELRAIRAEISKLADRVGESATRDELKGYVTRGEFEAHVAGHQRVVEGWRGWLPIALSACALLWVVVGPYVHFGAR